MNFKAKLKANKTPSSCNVPGLLSLPDGLVLQVLGHVHAQSSVVTKNAKFTPA
jgi:hypothetical protein